MKNILHIISSPRAELSASRKLGNAVVEKIKAKYTDAVIKERDLAKDHVPFLEEKHINTFFSPAENYSAEQSENEQIFRRTDCGATGSGHHCC